MKNAQEYVRKLKQLNAKLKKEGSKATVENVDDSTQILVMGILSNFASEQRAAAAMRKLMETVVDMNDLRVSAVADLVPIIGLDFPRARQAAMEITQVFNSIFNSQHHLDVSFLKGQSKKAVNAFLQGLDGLAPHTAAFFRNRYLSHNDVPLDEHMFAYLQRTGCVPPDISNEEAQKFVSDQFKDREAANFYAMFKKFAAAHAPRKGAKKPELVGAGAARSKASPNAGPMPEEDEPAEPSRKAKSARPDGDAGRKSARPKADKSRGKSAPKAKAEKTAAKKPRRK
jgi:endonuclease III